EAVRRLRGAGDVEACASGAPAENGASAGACDAILQLGLAPLGVGEGGRVASAGFGEGLGPLAVVPTLPRLGGEPVEAASLAEVDLELLEKLQAAKRREKEQGATPAERAAGWDAVARHERENPYREQAAARRDEWTAVAQAQEKYREQVGQVCAKHARDVDRLAKLLALDDDVVPARQKQAYRAEMQQVYEPWAKELSACRAGGGEPDMALLAPASRRPESERPSRPATAAPDFEGEPSGEPSGDARWTAGWWVGGLGVAALGAGVVMGAVAKAQYDEASEPCPDGVCRTTADQDSAMAGRDDARTLGTAGTVVGIAGSVVGALGLTLVLTGDSSPPRAPREARVVGTVGAAGAWIGIAGEL
ncbi:MAG: hypothetical protein HY744_12490, partial [Deltaproteobacteria bacterium]|nr:hypothetical protein [Deltaproteobacteria bacterium]